MELWEQCVRLCREERLVLANQALRKIRVRRAGRERSEYQSGLLALTDLRLIWMRQEQPTKPAEPTKRARLAGLQALGLARTRRPARGTRSTGSGERDPGDYAPGLIRFGFEFNLCEIESVKVGGIVTQHVEVRYRHGCEEFLVRASLKGGVVSPHKFCDRVNRNIETRQVIQTQDEDGLGRVEVDFGIIRNMVDKGGFGTGRVTVLCPYCGVSTPIPRMGCTMFCRHCQSALSFTEMFNMVKHAQEATTGWAVIGSASS